MNYDYFQRNYQTIQRVINSLKFIDMPMDPQPKYINDLLSNHVYTENVQKLESTMEIIMNKSFQLTNTIKSILQLQNRKSLKSSIDDYFKELNKRYKEKIIYIDDLVDWVLNNEAYLIIIFCVFNGLLTLSVLIMLISIIASYGRLSNKCIKYILVLLIIITVFNYPLFIGALLFSTFRELVTQFKCTVPVFIDKMNQQERYICNNSSDYNYYLYSSDIDELKSMLTYYQGLIKLKGDVILTETMKSEITSLTQTISTYVKPYKYTSNIQNTDGTNYNDIYNIGHNEYCSYSSYYQDIECVTALNYLYSVDSFCDTAQTLGEESFLYTLEDVLIYHSRLNQSFYEDLDESDKFSDDIKIPLYECSNSKNNNNYYYENYYYRYSDSKCINSKYRNEYTVIMLSIFYYFFSVTCFIFIYHRQKGSTCCGCCLCCSCCKFCNCCGCCGCCLFEEQDNKPKGELEDVHLKKEPESIVIPKDKETNLPSPTGENQNEEEEIINNIPSEPNVLQEEEENQEIFKELFPTEGGEYSKISQIDPHIHINKLHSNKITSFISLTNGKFVSGCSEGSMCLTSINYDSKTWNKEITLPKAHNQAITSLCESGTNKLVSSSLDHTIKIWDIEAKTFDLITTLTDHTDSVYKVITLSSNNNIMSCSGDQTIRLWNNLAYHQLATLKEENPVYYISELKHHGNIIIANCGNDQFEYYLSFWNTDTNTSDKIAFNAKTNAMIELSRNLIAVAAMNPNCIVFIINPILFQIVKQVEIKNLTGNACGMCKYDDGSLLCGTEGRLSQIMLCENMKIGYTNEKKEKKFDGQNGIVVVENGEYIVGCDNNNKGLYVFKIEHQKTV